MKFTDFFKKADILLLASLFLLGVLSILFVQLRSGDSSDTVVITVDGNTFGSYPLSQDREIEVRTEFGFNRVTIRDGSVSITESDCPGHDCEAFGRISRPRQVILCMPHRLCVSIERETDVDMVSY